MLPLKTLLKGKVARRGSLEMYATDPLGSSLAGQLEIVYSGEERRAAIDEELLMPSTTTSHTLRGISLQSDAAPFVSVSNVADRQAIATLTCNYSNGHTTSIPVSLNHHETKLLKACSGIVDSQDVEALLMQAPEKAGESQPVGIQIASADPKSELQAFGITPHTVLDHRYFSAINFTDPKELNSLQSIYAGVPVGYSALLGNTFSPHFAFSNFTNKIQTVALKSYTADGALQTENGPRQLTLQPYASGVLTVTGNANTSASESYVTTATGNPGDVFGALMDQADAGDNRFLIIGKDPSTDLNAGMHPWVADKDNHAILIAFNHTGKPQDVTLRIGTGNGGLWQRRITMQPYQTLTEDLNQLLAAKESRDDGGKVLPKGLTKGEVSWWTNDSRRVTGRLVEVSTADHMVQNFSCYGQIVLCGITAYANPEDGSIGTFFNLLPA